MTRRAQKGRRPGREADGRTGVTALRPWRAVVALLGCLMSPPLALAQAQTQGPERPVHTAQEESLSEGVKAVVEDAKALLTAPSRMDRDDWLKVGAGTAVVGGLIAADHSIQDWVDRNNKSTTGKNIADGFNTLGNPITLAAVNAGVIAIGVANQSYGGGSWIKEAGLVGLEAEGFAVVAAEALGALTGRARPDKHQGSTSFNPFSGNSSFGSTHAAASFAVAAVFADRFDPAIGWLSYGLAAAVAASRVYTDKHFASDVVVGALIGWGLGKFISRQHGGDPDDWKIRPLAMERGVGGGLMIGKRF